jgi:integrase
LPLSGFFASQLLRKRSTYTLLTQEDEMNGSMNHLANGRWRVRWRDPDGRSRSRTFDEKQDARSWLALVRHKTATQELPLPPKVTVGEWVDQWLERKEATLRPSTYIDYVSIFRNHLPNAWRDRPVGSITRSGAQQLIIRLVADGKAGRARKVRAVFSCCFSEAVAEGLSPRNPFSKVAIGRRHVEHDSRHGDRHITCPSPSDVWRIAEVVPEWAVPVVLVAGFAGLRWGEIVGLAAHDIDLATNEVTVRRAYSIATRQLGPPKSDSSRRRAVFSSGIREQLAAAILRSESSGLVFPSPSGGFIDHSMFRRRVWLPAMRQLDMEGVRFHDLRVRHEALCDRVG